MQLKEIELKDREAGNGRWNGEELCLTYIGTADHPEIRLLLAAAMSNTPVHITGVFGSIRGSVLHQMFPRERRWEFQAIPMVSYR